MTDLAPPVWVTKRDGRLEPFEADRISRALFAAGEGLGRPDAFLARELADSAVHFLAEECQGATPTTARIAEVVAQVVRELGHPTLARAFEGRRKPQTPLAPALSLAEVLAAAARSFTLQTVYSRDLAAAQEDGLITLAGLATPGQLAGCVLGAHSASEDLESVHRVAGQVVALDGLEHHRDRSPTDLAEGIARAQRLTGLDVVVNLNLAVTPSWAASLAAGPLFGRSSGDALALHLRADDLLACLSRLGVARVRIDWHLGNSDFEDRERLLNVLRLALAGAAMGFTFDRPRGPVHLAEGLGRNHPATLLLAGLHLPTLLRQPGMLADADRFVQRLGSLVRLALSAAVQKRTFLRREAEANITSGFLLDRARFVAVPVGLDDVVKQFTGWSMTSGGPSLELGRRIVSRLAEVLRQESRAAHLEACLDGPFSFALEGVAGLTPWDESASLQSQLRAGGALHSISDGGTMALFVGDATAEQIAEALAQAWRQTDVVRVRLMRPRPEQAAFA